MSTVQLTKDWSNSIFPNLRRTFTSLNDTAGWWIFQNTQQLSAKWTRKWESDGTTGPSGAGDTTQRLTSVAACSVRASAAAAPQSWGVYQATNGAQILIDYQGATDDVIRIGYSRQGLYTLAGTTTNQPTATDELVISSGNSIVNATASLDRVMTIWCIDGDWRCAIFRSNAIVNVIGLSLITPLVSTRITNPIFTPPFAAYRYTAVKLALSGDGAGTGPTANGVYATAIGATGFVGTMARVYTDSLRNIRVGGGNIMMMAVTNTYFGTSQSPTFTADKPALQNGEGSPLLPIYWSGERTANMDGFLGSPIDWWAAYTSTNNTPAPNDPYSAWDPGDTPGVTVPRSNWLMALGSACVWPWRNVAANLEIS